MSIRDRVRRIFQPKEKVMSWNSSRGETRGWRPATGEVRNNTLTAADVLEGAHNLLTSYSVNWIQNDFAKDSRGNSVPANDPAACQFCLVGSLYKAANLDHTQASSLQNPAIVEAKRRLASVIRLDSRNVEIPAQYNDRRETSRDDVVRALASAKSSARAAGV